MYRGSKICRLLPKDGRIFGMGSQRQIDVHCLEMNAAGVKVDLGLEYLSNFLQYHVNSATALVSGTVASSCHVLKYLLVPSSFQVF